MEPKDMEPPPEVLLTDTHSPAEVMIIFYQPI